MSDDGHKHACLALFTPAVAVLEDNFRFALPSEWQVTCATISLQDREAMIGLLHSLLSRKVTRLQRVIVFLSATEFSSDLKKYDGVLQCLKSFFGVWSEGDHLNFVFVDCDEADQSHIDLKLQCTAKTMGVKRFYLPKGGSSLDSLMVHLVKTSNVPLDIMQRPPIAMTTTETERIIDGTLAAVRKLKHELKIDETSQATDQTIASLTLESVPQLKKVQPYLWTHRLKLRQLQSEVQSLGSSRAEKVQRSLLTCLQVKE